MKKLFLIFAFLTLSVGLWAEEQRVSYVYPVYNTEGDPTSGIKEWGKASVNATVVMKADERVVWYTDWYVVTGTNVTLANGAVCKGNVKLILADGAQLNASGKVIIVRTKPILASKYRAKTAHLLSMVKLKILANSLQLVSKKLPVSVADLMIPVQILPSMAVLLRQQADLILPVSVAEKVVAALTSLSMAVRSQQMEHHLVPVSVAD